jgi:hypothetical protein
MSGELSRMIALPNVNFVRRTEESGSFASAEKITLGVVKQFCQNKSEKWQLCLITILPFW